MSQRSVARAAGLLMGATLVSRLLGFIRERAVADIFGRTGVTDAFFAAFAIPDLMYYLLVGGALSAAFIPIFTEYLALGKKEEAWHVANSFINLTVLLLVLFTLLGVIFAPLLAPLVAYSYQGEQLALLIHLMRMMFPAVFFTALAGLLMGVLNSYQEFAITSMGPIIYNIFIILGAYFLGPRIGIIGMALGVVVGAMGNFLLQLGGLGTRRAMYRPVIDLNHPGLRRMFKLMIPSIIGLSVVQINLLINQNMASGLSEGSISALRYANRLMQLPLGVFAMAISTAVFPTLTHLAARGEREEFKSIFSFALRTIFFITVPATVGLMVLAEPIVRLLYQTGEFTSTDTRVTAVAMAFFALGLIPQSAIQVITRIFYALQDTVTPVTVGISSVLINIFLNFIFLRFTHLGSGGLALAFSLASIVNMMVLVWLLRTKLENIDGRRLWATFVKSIAGSLAMGTVVYFLAVLIGSHVDLSLTRGRLLEVGAPILAGIIIYVASAVLLRMEELQSILDMVRRRFQKEGGPASPKPEGA